MFEITTINVVLEPVKIEYKIEGVAEETKAFRI